MAPKVRENRNQTPKVDIWGLGVTAVECLEELQPEKERQRRFPEWKQWYQFLQTSLNQYQHVRPFAPMLAVNADRRPTARDLLNVQNPPTNATLAILGIPPLVSQANGTTTIYSAAPTPMDWTQTVAAGILSVVLKLQEHGTTQDRESYQTVC